MIIIIINIIIISVSVIIIIIIIIIISVIALTHPCLTPIFTSKLSEGSPSMQYRCRHDCCHAAVEPY